MLLRAHPHVYKSNFLVITYPFFLSNHVVLFPHFIELVAGAQQVASGQGRAFSASDDPSSFSVFTRKGQFLQYFIQAYYWVSSICLFCSNFVYLYISPKANKLLDLIADKWPC